MSRAVESAAEVNHLRFESARIRSEGGRLIELLEIERKRADHYEAQARKYAALAGARL